METSITHYLELYHQRLAKLGVAPVVGQTEIQAGVGDVKEYDPCSKTLRSQSDPTYLEVKLVMMLGVYHL